MNAHEYTLEFKGYKLEGNENTFEHDSGIYCVYACTYNPVENTVRIRRLLYIGQAEDFNVRHQNHNKKSEWNAQLLSGEKLCYSRAHLGVRSLDICEAAMIFEHQPVCNDTADVGFHHDTTHILTTGKNSLLHTDFTVYRTAD